MASSEIVALFLVGALLLYLILGIADFGGGILSGLSRGPRARAQRQLVESAIAPIWEANHVWLILALVLLFVGFPKAFRALSEALHVPLELMLLGIVLRGSAFVFRQYGPVTDRHLWRRVFSVASFTTPFFLGATLGAITSGSIRVETAGQFTGWLAPFPFAVGILTTVAGTFLASVYLTREATDPDLRGDFVVRARVCAVLLAVSAAAAALLVPETAVWFRERFPKYWPIPTLAPFSLVGSLYLLKRAPSLWPPVLAAVAVGLLLVGWTVAQFPFLIAPDLTLYSAAAPESTLRPLVLSLVAGSVLVIPSLYWMMKVFKTSR